MPCHNRLRAAESARRRSVLPSAAIALPGHTSPRPALPSPNLPNTALPHHGHSPREQQGEHKPSVLPSAAIASPCRVQVNHTRPSYARPRQAKPCLLFKRAAGSLSRSSVLPSAAIALPCQRPALPDRIKPILTAPNSAETSRAMP